jgi:hypothetical protein
MEAIRPPKRRLTQDLHSVTFHKTTIFIVTAVKNLKLELMFTFISCLFRPQGPSAAGRIRSIEKSNDYIGNRTRDLPIVAQCLSYSTQPLTEMTARNLSGDKGRSARKADNLTAKCGSLDVYLPYGPPRPVTGITFSSCLFHLLTWISYPLLWISRQWWKKNVNPNFMDRNYPSPCLHNLPLARILRHFNQTHPFTSSISRIHHSWSANRYRPPTGTPNYCACNIYVKPQKESTTSSMSNPVIHF